MIELEEPATLEKGRLQKTLPSLLIASAITQGSKIALYSLRYNFGLQSSVFIYPMGFILTSEKIQSLDPSFEKVNPVKLVREFREFTPEVLDRHFMNLIKPLYSNFDHKYSSNELQILEHSFPYQSLEYLKGTISDIKA